MPTVNSLDLANACKIALLQEEGHFKRPTPPVGHVLKTWLTEVRRFLFGRPPLPKPSARAEFLIKVRDKALSKPADTEVKVPITTWMLLFPYLKQVKS